MSKVMLLLPEELLREVDRVVKREGTNRSALIRWAVSSHLHQLRLRRLRTQLAQDAEELARLYPTLRAELGEEAWMVAENEALFDLEKGARHGRMEKRGRLSRKA